MGQVEQSAPRRGLALVVGVVLVISAAVVIPDPVAAETEVPDDPPVELGEVDPLEVDRSQERVDEALDGLGERDDAGEVPLPPGALDGQLRPEEFDACVDAPALPEGLGESLDGFDGVEGLAEEFPGADGDGMLGEGGDCSEDEGGITVLSSDADGVAYPSPPAFGEEDEAEIEELAESVDVPPEDLNEWSEEEFSSPQSWGADDVPPAVEDAADADDPDVDGADDGGELVELARELELDPGDFEPGDEVEELRTVESRTVVNDDGLFETELGSEPLFAEAAGGELVEFDFEAHGRRDGRYGPAVGPPGGVSFAPQADD